MINDPDKFRGKYRISEARWKGFDYGSKAMYFVTICTKNRVNYFGEIAVEPDNYPSLQMTEIAKTTNGFWLEIPKHYPFVKLDQFVLMPNHLHGILIFQKEDYNEWNPNKFGVQSQNLAAVIRAFKSSVKRFANQNEIDFEWQARYHDRVIRNFEELNRIRIYIKNNPANWGKDKHFQS